MAKRRNTFSARAADSPLTPCGGARSRAARADGGDDGSGEPSSASGGRPPEGRLLLGEIGAAQGLKGEVRIRSYTQDPAAIADYGPLEDGRGGLVEIDSVRVTPKAVIARIKGVTTREGAEALNHTKLYIDRARLPEAAEEDEWYHADLIGLSAVTRDGTPVGTVTGLLNFGAGDIVEIAPTAGGVSILIPFTEAAVPEVDMAAGSITVVPPEELEP